MPPKTKKSVKVRLPTQTKQKVCQAKKQVGTIDKIKACTMASLKDEKKQRGATCFLFSAALAELYPRSQGQWRNQHVECHE